MMEHPTNSKGENVDEMKSVSLEPDREDPSPKPDTKSDGGAIKATSNVDVNDADADLKEKSSENNVEASAEGSKAKKSVRWSQELVIESPIPRESNHGSTVNHSQATAASSSSFNFKETMGGFKDTLGRWGKKMGEATRKAEDFAGNTWQHLKTSPSMTDAALGRIAQGTKVIAEGGYEKIFRQTFETVPEEQLKNSFACYLSTSAGPVMGVLYISTSKLAFCSDNPLSYQAADNKTEWSYYKAVIPLNQLKAVNPSTSRSNSAEKYIQVICVDNHEFWYMGFLNYNGATECLDEALKAREELSV